MKINKPNNAYNAIKEQLKEKITQSKIQAGETFKESAQKASRWAGEKIQEVQSSYDEVKKKVEPKVDEFITNAQFFMTPPKEVSLRKNVTELQKKVLQKSVMLTELKKRDPNQMYLIYKHTIELQKLERETQSAIEKYNDFVARQAACQQAFNKLNNL